MTLIRTALLPLLLLSALATACFPPRDHDCVTKGGLLVHGVCDAQLDDIQSRIESAALALGYRPHVLRDALLWTRPDVFDGPYGYKQQGITYCPQGMIILTVLPGARWEETSLAHEAFHFAQGCQQWDVNVFRACLAEGGEDADCDYEAFHPYWERDVYPAIARVNAGGRL
jgi:hypothetical protein